MRVGDYLLIRRVMMLLVCLSVLGLWGERARAGNHPIVQSPSARRKVIGPAPLHKAPFSYGLYQKQKREAFDISVLGARLWIGGYVAQVLPGMMVAGIMLPVNLFDVGVGFQMLIPVAGPFFLVSYVLSRKEGGVGWLAFPMTIGVVQVVGVSMMIGGVVRTVVLRERWKASFRRRPPVTTRKRRVVSLGDFR